MRQSPPIQERQVFILDALLRANAVDADHRLDMSEVMSRSKWHASYHVFTLVIADLKGRGLIEETDTWAGIRRSDDRRSLARRRPRRRTSWFHLTIGSYVRSRALALAGTRALVPVPDISPLRKPFLSGAEREQPVNSWASVNQRFREFWTGDFGVSKEPSRFLPNSN